MYYMIRTERERYYLLNEKGEITQYRGSIPCCQHSFSHDWAVLGLSKILPFGNIGPIENVYSFVGKNLRYKNGKGAYVLHDLDHGTHRTWGNDNIISVFEWKHA